MPPDQPQLRLWAVQISIKYQSSHGYRANKSIHIAAPDIITAIHEAERVLLEENESALKDEWKWTEYWINSVSHKGVVHRVVEEADAI